MFALTRFVGCITYLLFFSSPRFTDPVVGVRVFLRVTVVDQTVQFDIDIVDHCSGGLPQYVANFLKERLGSSFVKVSNQAHGVLKASHSFSSHERSPGTAVSSLMGTPVSDDAGDTLIAPPDLALLSSPSDAQQLPPEFVKNVIGGLQRLVEDVDVLTHSGNSFGLHIYTTKRGTTASINFTTQMVTPVPQGLVGETTTSHSRLVIDGKKYFLNITAQINAYIVIFFCHRNIFSCR